MWEKKPAEAHSTFSHSTDMFLAQSYADVVLDVFIITLPIPLGTSASKKATCISANC
ncbi:hypothetical protein F5Y05DRAFT_387745 [Hypoxylon sp. FL0543]|nr:hypothetical protein F5Y05DRAFT_387745 [Hypoxylon sp. FL0543]